MKNLELIKKICEECITEGEALLLTKWVSDSIGGMQLINPTTYVDLEKFKEWESNCNVLISILENYSDPWSKLFKGDKINSFIEAKSMLGGLKSILSAVDKGYLIRVEELVYAEAFSNLMEQAEYLFSLKYFLAAGVITRAVLEEKLKNLCHSSDLNFSKPNPTLSDYNNELYKSKKIDKIEMKNIDFLISVGNNAAHNQPIKEDEIQKMISGVKAILTKYN
ncbi:MAG: DUF4145 domain-containing protein [Firmicutes bacterium]|nr:DUF4145 domain-containing protein [Bacillota bacterium]